MKRIRYFSLFERMLWLFSAVGIVAVFLLFDRQNYGYPAASLIGVTSLLFNAKGNPVGQALMVIFSFLYGWISYKMCYYGEMITYVGMTAPMALFSLIAWLRHPFAGNLGEVTVKKLKKKDMAAALFLSGTVTLLFYFVLRYFRTAYLPLSTVSVTSSFLAVYLTWRRSALYALAYAANDVILIALWLLASLQERSYLSLTVCFVIFLVNDLYGFVSWQRMEKRQGSVSG